MYILSLQLYLCTYESCSLISLHGHMQGSHELLKTIRREQSNIQLMKKHYRKFTAGGWRFFEVHRSETLARCLWRWTTAAGAPNWGRWRRRGGTRDRRRRRRRRRGRRRHARPPHRCGKTMTINYWIYVIMSSQLRVDEIQNIL